MVEDKEYVLPAVVAVALQTSRPEVLRALKDEAADTLKKLPEAEKAAMVSELFKLIADMMEDKDKLKKKLEIYYDLSSSFEGIRDEADTVIDELNDRLQAVDAKK
jgi:hypothetical protein